MVTPRHRFWWRTIPLLAAIAAEIGLPGLLRWLRGRMVSYTDQHDLGIPVERVRELQRIRNAAYASKSLDAPSGARRAPQGTAAGRDRSAASVRFSFADMLPSPSAQPDEVRGTPPHASAPFSDGRRFQGAAPSNGTGDRSWRLTLTAYGYACLTARACARGPLPRAPCRRARAWVVDGTRATGDRPPSR